MFADPLSIVKQFELREGMRVADFGAGSGAYTFPMADIVRGNGMIYAVEVQKDLLKRIQNDAAARHVTNVTPLWANIEKIGGTKLADRSLDGVLVSNVLFQIPEKETCVREIARITKPAGAVFLVDWAESFGGMGPRPEDVLPEAKARALFEANGFSYERVLSAGAHHYGMILRRA